MRLFRQECRGIWRLLVGACSQEVVGKDHCDARSANAKSFSYFLSVRFVLSVVLNKVSLVGKFISVRVEIIPVRITFIPVRVHIYLCSRSERIYNSHIFPPRGDKRGVSHFFSFIDFFYKQRKKNSSDITSKLVTMNFLNVLAVSIM